MGSTSDNLKSIVIAATPTAPLLSHLLHALSHQPGITVTVLTRKTTVSLPLSSGHSHSHNHDSNAHHHDAEILHIETSFSAAELQTHLRKNDTLICYLEGSDLHLSADLIDAATAAGVKTFIPSEYGLDTSNAKVRELLHPYRMRYETQQKLKSSGMNWTAIYSGVELEEAMKADGVLGIDCLWASVVVFPHDRNLRIAVSTYKDIAKSIVEVATERRKVEGNEVWTCSFQASQDELVEAVEKKLERGLDRYEGLIEGAKKEANERMRRGYFDGGVALMGRVAVWDDRVGAWAGWKGVSEGGKDGWRDEVGRVALTVRNGEIGGDGGCGC
ncbi:uncharacterized protein BDZ99DRAFT_562411 [Mytilinidion resinicola]|uniref:NmrA-like domain-containing protein n=1 Tax=Mytilinidion resinicola TaxID=574789 RepID=A0A6A6YR76_9PEZI|nr:uncharacterized protein BDZ99DRAFT_562411 [Mytilinidion resinicola]KAF2811290.1 hypothetical protein BDZ99DRAFT_562411 [Mytilinidion resinicola]